MMTSTPRVHRTAAHLREASREVARLAARRGCPLPAWSAWQSTLELGTLAGSVPCARLHARQVLWEWGLRDPADAELLVSELVTNSVEAARPGETAQSIWLRLSMRQTGLLIEVWDADLNPPVPTETEDGIPPLEDESGRGLFLVGTLSRAWGWHPTRTPDGKVTWCELGTPLPPDRPPRLRRSPMSHQLIASPYPEGHIVVSPGWEGGIKIGANKYAELRNAAPAVLVPEWLTDAASAQWGLDTTGLPVQGTVMIRPETPYGYARASYEVNLWCNYGCEHCYLGDRPFAGLDWPGRERLLSAMRDAGVLWLQLTGGEPLIDPLFPETLKRAFELGMMVQVSSNGSRLAHGKTLELLTAYRPYRMTISLYGASEASYDGMTQRKGSFKRFIRGLEAACEAELNLRVNIVVSRHNAHEREEMQAIAERFGVPSFEYTNISPTIHGTGEVLPSQAPEVLRRRKPYTGCNAGITHFHADPHGLASICKVGRDPQVNLVEEGPEGLRKLAAVADSLVTRHGGCSGCALQKTCGTCMPLVNLYRQASAPLDTYCQHGSGPLSLASEGGE